MEGPVAEKKKLGDNLASLQKIVEVLKEGMDKMMTDNQKVVEIQKEGIEKLTERVAALEERESKKEEEQKAESYDENTLPTHVNAKFGFNKYGLQNHEKGNKLVFSENGTRVRNNGTIRYGHNIVSMTGFSKGVNIWKIKANSLHCSEGAFWCFNFLNGCAHPLKETN